MSIQRLSVLFCGVLVFVVAHGPSASGQVAEYTEVTAWPSPATSAAGTPAAWNFGDSVIEFLEGASASSPR